MLLAGALSFLFIPTVYSQAGFDSSYAQAQLILRSEIENPGVAGAAVGEPVVCDTRPDNGQDTVRLTARIAGPKDLLNVTLTRGDQTLLRTASVQGASAEKWTRFSLSDSVRAAFPAGMERMTHFFAYVDGDFGSVRLKCSKTRPGVW